MGFGNIALKRIKSNGMKLRLTSEAFFSIFLCLIWANYTLVKFIRAVLIRIPYIKDIREHILIYFFLLVLVFSIPHMLRNIDPKTVILYFFVFGIYILNLIIYPENQVALEDNIVPFLFKALPLIFVGATVDLKKHYKLLYGLSLASIIATFIHLIIEPSNVSEGNMSSSYHLLPHVCLVIAATLSKINVVNLLGSIVGVITIFSFGTRGPIFCILFLILAYIFIYKNIRKNMFFYILTIALILYIMFFYDDILKLLLSLIERWGMSTRVLDILLYGDILDSNGRDIIQGKLLEAVKDNWFGYGIAGDRAIAGAYSHNILIELLVSYGIVLGTIIFVLPIFFTIKILLRRRKEQSIETGFILALIAANYIKLFMSGSYLNEQFLYLLMGLLFAESRLESRASSEPLSKKLVVIK